MDKMDNEARGIGGQGPLVKVTWNDAAQNIKIHAIDATHPENHLAVCETIGELVIDDPKALILVQHWSDTDGIDILAIPKDWCTKIEVMEIVGEAITDPCIIENLESQQESQDVSTLKNSKNK